MGWLLSTAGAGAELTALQQNIDAQVAEIDSIKDSLSQAQQRLATLEAEQSALESEGDDLAARRAAALAALRAQFEKVTADPSLPLEAELQAYRDAAAAQVRQRETLATQQKQIAASRERIAELRALAGARAEALAKLRSGFDRARAQRLLREINVAGEQRLTSAVTCAPDETIAGCIERGEQTARREARARFADELFARVTEADVVARHQVQAGVEPTLEESEVTDSGFRGQGEYFVTLRARLRNEATLADACRLLGLTDAQCRGELRVPSAETMAPDVEPEPEVAMIPEAALPAEEEDTPATAEATAERYRLTVRSNVYYDEVYIDGVPYGSTKVDVMLPPGEYDIEVRKPGHASYRERINLTASRTLRAQLAELSEQ
jgi:hypothetical protein